MLISEGSSHSSLVILKRISALAGYGEMEPPQWPSLSWQRCVIPSHQCGVRDIPPTPEGTRTCPSLGAPRGAEVAGELPRDLGGALPLISPLPRYRRSNKSLRGCPRVWCPLLSGKPPERRLHRTEVSYTHITPYVC